MMHIPVVANSLQWYDYPAVAFVVLLAVGLWAAWRALRAMLDAEDALEDWQ